ncbi:MAG: ABC transporter ATP-binding protein [Planctomycetes bacterium]|nr:ABC transporter ATP-binding protein [Planctomycetota bacterium]
MHVEMRGVGRSYGAVRALHGIDLALPAGSRTAWIGPNGSGKSTLTRALLGLIRHEGEIRFDGVTRAEDGVSIAARIAYVPQVAPRLAASVGELTRAVCALRRRPVDSVSACAAELGLEPRELASRPLRTLSAGMRQKVLASLALASGAELLVLDEPTASMDARSRRAFFRLVDGLPRSTTVVLCSHRLDEIRSLVDRIAVLAEGRLRFCGAAEQFLRQRSMSLIEVRALDGAEPLLRSLGFERNAMGWWSSVVPTTERAHTVRWLASCVGDQLVDLLAQDLEDLGERPIEHGAARCELDGCRSTEVAS